MSQTSGADLTLPMKEKDKCYQEDDVSDDERAEESGEEFGEESAEESEEEVVNWIQGWSDDHNRHYYFNKTTGESRWVAPDEPYEVKGSSSEEGSEEESEEETEEETEEESGDETESDSGTAD